MSEVASKTREYLQERIEFLEKGIDSLSPTESTLSFQMKAMVSELKQAQLVLNGGKSVFEQVKQMDHA